MVVGVQMTDLLLSEVFRSLYTYLWASSPWRPFLVLYVLSGYMVFELVRVWKVTSRPSGKRLSFLREGFHVFRGTLAFLLFSICLIYFLPHATEFLVSGSQRVLAIVTGAPSTELLESSNTESELLTVRPSSEVPSPSFFYTDEEWADSVQVCLVSDVDPDPVLKTVFQSHPVPQQAKLRQFLDMNGNLIMLGVFKCTLPGCGQAIECRDGGD